jgi:hypothetical protein
MIFYFFGVIKRKFLLKEIFPLIFFSKKFNKHVEDKNVLKFNFVIEYF